MIRVHKFQRGDVSADTMRRLRGIAPATFGHIIEDGFADGALRPLSGLSTVRVLGRALTVRCRGGDGAAVHLAIDWAEEGDVLVIDRGGDVSRACWGEMTTRAAMERGVVATVVDGAVTDVAEIFELHYPVWARGVTALTTVSRGEGGEIGGAVEVGGVRVRSGDLVLADENGVLFLSPARMEGVLDVAEARELREEQVRKDISGGHSLAEISGAAKAEIEMVEAEEV